MPKLLPVPPRRAQNRSALLSSLARTMRPSASITSMSTTLSQFMPNLREVKP